MIDQPLMQNGSIQCIVTDLQPCSNRETVDLPDSSGHKNEADINGAKQNPHLISGVGVLFEANNELTMPYSHMANATLPSAQRGFTSEFGKGSGGSLSL